MSIQRGGGRSDDGGRPRPWDDGPRPIPPGGDARSHRLRFQEFFEFAPDPLVVTDERGLILEANHAAAALLGRRKEFLIDKPLGLFVMPASRSPFYTFLASLKRGAESGEFEIQVDRRGEARQVSVRAVDDRAHTGPGQVRWMLRDVTEERKNEQARTRLLQKLATAQEDERHRIARELHDEMGQHLTALILDLKLLGDTFAEGRPERERIDRIIRAAGLIGQAMHRVATALRPTALDDLGLAASLRNLADDWSARTGIRASFRGVGPTGSRLPIEVETTIYRITQEALTNVARHAMASHASVILERRRGSLRLIVEDDGRGFDPDRASGPHPVDNRLGLLGMQERVALLGGTFTIESGSGGPTSLFVEVPLPHDERRAGDG